MKILQFKCEECYNKWHNIIMSDMHNEQKISEKQKQLNSKGIETRIIDK